jgi:hypothetical protein
LFIIQNYLSNLLPLSLEDLGFRLFFVCGLYKKDKGKVFSVYAAKAHGGSAGIVSFILNLGTGCRTVVNFTRRKLYRRETRLNLLAMRLGGPQNRSGQFGEEKIYYPYWDTNPGPSSP